MAKQPRVSGLRSVEFGVPSVAAATRFYSGVWGLVPVSSGARDATALRATGSAHPIVVLRDNDPLGTTTPGAPSLVLLPNAWLSEPDVGCSDYVASVLLARPTPLGGSVLLVDGTALYGSATAGSDYAAFAPLRLNFPAGSNSARFVLQICGDALPEADEEIDIRAVAPVGVQLVDNDLDLVLRNDD